MLGCCLGDRQFSENSVFSGMTEGYPRTYASSICSIPESSSYEKARLYIVKQTVFTISSFVTKGFMSGESFESSIHRIIVLLLTPEENSIATQLSEVWIIKCGEM